MNKLFVFFSIVFIAVSPWFISLAGQYKNVNINNLELLNLGQYDIDEINTLRGELWQKDVNKNFAKIIVNKYSVYFQELVKRYLVSFDPHYLFFVGSKDVLLNTQSQGVLYLSYLFFIMYFFYKNKDKKLNKIFIMLLIITPIFGAFSEAEYELVTRIPVFLVLSIIAACGYCYFITSKKRFYVFIVTMFLVFEFLRFAHYFYFIYPIDQLLFLSK